MDHRADSGRFGARIDHAVQRWGVHTALAVGALVVFSGLGQTGLWDPWEIDRADLGRTLVAPAQIAVGVGGSGDVRDAVTAVSRDLGIVPRFAPAPRKSPKSGLAASRTVRETLSRARSAMVTAVLFERDVLTPKSADDTAWNRAYEVLRDAQRAIPNGDVIVVSAPSAPEAEGAPTDATDSWERSLAVARIRSAWSALESTFKLSEVSWPPAGDAFWDSHAGEGHGLERLVIVTPTAGQGVEAPLREALASATSHGGIVQYKENGNTYTLPPLRHWLAALSYGVLGTSETSARLPGALLAFLALLALVLATRSLYGPRVAMLAGLILATCPLFFAQARSVAGEPGAILGLTLVTMGLLRHAAGQTGRAVWSWLLLGLTIGFFAKGLTAPLTYACIAAAVAIVAMPRERSGWAPTAVLIALFAALTLWVETSPADGFAGQFRFTLPIFSEGPTDYERNFDYAMKAIGFGLFPWSPLVVLAMAWAVRVASREEDGASLVLVAAFVVPTVVSMGFLKDFNHLFWPAAPVTALALALAFERLDEVSDRAGTVMAFLVLVMGYILARELGKSAEPLAGLLAYDPPFSDKAGSRFPSDVGVATWARVALLTVTLPFVIHFSRIATALKPVASFFRRDTPWVITLSVVTVLLPLTWVIRVGSAFVIGMDTTNARGLSVAQRYWHFQILQGGDPIALLALGSFVVIGLTWLVRYVLLWRRYAGRPAPEPGWRSDAPALWTAAGAFLLLAMHMLWVVWPAGDASWPEGYWSGVLFSFEVAVLVLGAAIALWRLGPEHRRTVLTSIVAILGLWLGTRLVRDVMFFPPVAIGATAAGGVAWAIYIVPRVWRAPRQGAAIGAAVVAAGLLAWAMPLLERWDRVSGFIYEGSQESLARYLMTSSSLSWLCYLTVAGLLINRRWPRGAELLLGRVGGWFERGQVARGVAVAGALVFSAALLADFYPSMAHHVSQKHVIESYEKAIAGDQASAGDSAAAEMAGSDASRLFKHGRFAASGRTDANFYTAGIPSIAERNTALQVLLQGSDQTPSVETSAGASTQLLLGFDPANDVDGDGRRDHAVIRGVASLVAPGKLVDDSATWAPDEHAGKVLVGSKGKAYPIAGNDATTLRLATKARPMLKVRVSDPDHYAIDSADAAQHRATAMTPERRFLVLPSDTLSDMNHAFRKVSQGRHLPVLDGRSSRVMLAASWLEEGEEQENRFALHTTTPKAFEALDDPKVRRVWVNFDDSLQIVGYRLEDEVVSQGKNIELTVYYQVLKKVKASQKVFLHIDRQGTSNRIHGDHWPLNQGVGEEPQKTCVGCYRTDHWFVGDVVLDTFTTEVPTGTTAGVYELWMGLYNTATDKRMVVKKWDKANVRHDGSNRVRLGTLRVR